VDRTGCHQLVLGLQNNGEKSANPPRLHQHRLPSLEHSGADLRPLSVQQHTAHQPRVRRSVATVQVATCESKGLRSRVSCKACNRALCKPISVRFFAACVCLRSGSVRSLLLGDPSILNLYSPPHHGLSQGVERALVVLVAAVAEVEARHAHPRAQQVLHHPEVRGLGAQRAYNLHDTREREGDVVSAINHLEIHALDVNWGCFSPDTIIRGGAVSLTHTCARAPWFCTAPRGSRRGCHQSGCSPWLLSLCVALVRGGLWSEHGKSAKRKAREGRCAEARSVEILFASSTPLFSTFCHLIFINTPHSAPHPPPPHTRCTTTTTPLILLLLQPNKKER
jgi:hypothetical protein